MMSCWVITIAMELRPFVSPDSSHVVMGRSMTQAQEICGALLFNVIGFPFLISIEAKNIIWRFCKTQNSLTSASEQYLFLNN